MNTNIYDVFHNTVHVIAMLHLIKFLECLCVPNKWAEQALRFAARKCLYDVLETSSNHLPTFLKHSYQISFLVKRSFTVVSAPNNIA